MLPVQVQWYELQESKRHNRASEEANYQQAQASLQNARTNYLNYEVNKDNAATNARNAAINAMNAETNRLNYDVNVRNAESNFRNALSNERQASAAERNAATNARNAETSFLNLDVQRKLADASMLNASANMYNAATNRTQGEANINIQGMLANSQANLNYENAGYIHSQHIGQSIENQFAPLNQLSNLTLQQSQVLQNNTHAWSNLTQATQNSMNTLLAPINTVGHVIDAIVPGKTRKTSSVGKAVRIM